MTHDYQLQSTGDQQTFATGAVRDSQAGKGRFDLLPAVAIARLALHFEKGASHYGDRNWERGMPVKFLDVELAA